MRKNALAAALILAGCSQTDRVFVEADGISTWYIDSSSIKTMPSGYKRAWHIRAYYNHPDWRELRAYQEFDCGQERMRFLQVDTYFKDGEVEQGIRKPGLWSNVEYHNADEFNYVCFGKVPS